MTAVFFWPVFVLGHVITQSDLLYFYAPWNALRPSDLVVPSNTVLGDQTREFLPFFVIARQALKSLELPLWDPYIMAGTPLLANSQSALLFPLNLGHYVLPIPLGFTVAALLKPFLAGLGTYAFARNIKLSHAGALLSGTAYAFASFNIFWLNHPHTNVTLLFPLALLAVDRLVEQPNRRAVAFLGLIAGVQLLGGHAELAFLVAIAAGLYLMFRLFLDGRERAARWWAVRRLGGFVAGYLLGFLLAAVVELPFVEFLAHSATWHLRGVDNTFYINAIGLISLVLPHFFTLPAWADAGYGYHSLSLYGGIAPLLLAALALSYRPGRVELFFGILAAAAMAVMFNVGPLFGWLTQLPFFKQTPLFYMAIYAVLGLSLMAGVGLDKLWVLPSSVPRRAHAWFILLAIGLAGLLVAQSAGWLGALAPRLRVLGVPRVDELLQEASGGALRAALLAASCAVLGSAALWRWKFNAAYAFVPLAFADLCIAGSGWNPVVPRDWAIPGEPPAVRFLKQDREPFRIAAVDGVMPPDSAALVGIQDVGGYDVPVSYRYHAFFEKGLKGKAAWWIYEFPSISLDALPFFGLLNTNTF